MALPKITFNIANDGLGLVGDGVQKTPGLVITGNTAEGIGLGESKQIFSLKGAEDLGIDAETNPFAYKHLEDFYGEAGQGAPLWLMLVSEGTTYAAMADETEAYARKLQEDSRGAIRIMALLKESTGDEVIEDSLDADVNLGVANAQALADSFAEQYVPFRVLISGNSFNGNVQDLFDYSQSDYNRVSMLIGNDNGSNEASIGLALGRIARVPTQRSIARVKDGSILPLRAFFTGGDTSESLTNAWDTIHDKGYTFFRSFTGRSGYYFTDDKTLTRATDDFKYLSRGMVMDEAVIIVNETLTNELNDEIPVANDGTIHPAVIKAWQANIESALQENMVSQGKLSAAAAFIATGQQILVNNLTEVSLRLQPVGYAKEIEVNIGFTTNIEE